MKSGCILYLGDYRWVGCGFFRAALFFLKIVFDKVIQTASVTAGDNFFNFLQEIFPGDRFTVDFEPECDEALKMLVVPVLLRNHLHDPLKQCSKRAFLIFESDDFFSHCDSIEPLTLFGAHEPFVKMPRV